ncbi:MAG: hypothetical protein LBB67_08200, partial [Oscillospiraceae bacterium]|nr:hypothetical protein [Oscillospiraceae bacterium]
MGVPYKLKSPFDFSFLSKYGRVFKVYDDQDSGNICFGVTDEDKQYFIKFAGAPTDRACVSADEAIANSKLTVPIHKDLAHPTLIRYISSKAIGIVRVELRRLLFCRFGCIVTSTIASNVSLFTPIICL